MEVVRTIVQTVIEQHEPVHEDVINRLVAEELDTAVWVVRRQVGMALRHWKRAGLARSDRKVWQTQRTT